jgi:hypothetical protein
MLGRDVDILAQNEPLFPDKVSHLVFDFITNWSKNINLFPILSLVFFLDSLRPMQFVRQLWCVQDTLGVCGF